MKQISYTDYAEFRAERGTRVRKTEQAELKELQQHIATLTEQKDFYSLDILRNLAAIFAEDTQDEASKRQETILFTAANLMRASDRSLSFVSGIITKI